MLEMFLQIGGPLLGTALTGLVVFLLKKKFNLQITADQEKLLGDVLKKAIGFAEEWARKQAKLSGGVKAEVSGDAKLKVATDFVKTEIKRVGIKLTDKQVDELLHSSLGMLR